MLQMPAADQSTKAPEVRAYTCADTVKIAVPRKTAVVKAFWMARTVWTNLILYERDGSSKMRVSRPFVSGAKFDRDVRTLVGGSQGLRTMTFPGTLLAVQDQALSETNSLRAIRQNEGLITIGTSAFEKCGLRSVLLASTLEEIGGYTFNGCNSIKSMRFGTHGST